MLLIKKKTSLFFLRRCKIRNTNLDSYKRQNLKYLLYKIQKKKKKKRKKEKKKKKKKE